MSSIYKKEILNLLPHREPMLLIDELHDIKKLTSATAILNVKKDSFFVQGHFPINLLCQRINCRIFWPSCSSLTAHGLDKSTYKINCF